MNLPLTTKLSKLQPPHLLLSITHDVESNKHGAIMEKKHNNFATSLLSKMLKANFSLMNFVSFF